MKFQATVVLGLVSVVATPVVSAENFSRIGTRLTGLQEVPVVSTAGTGRFDAVIDDARREIRYVFSYENIQGTVTQAHIHVGRVATNGGISVWLCGNATAPGVTPAITPPAGTPGCDSPSDSFEGTIEPSNVVGPTAQAISPGEFEELVRMIRAGAAYVNVHSSVVPGGEIRGQIRAGRGHRRHD